MFCFINQMISLIKLLWKKMLASVQMMVSKCFFFFFFENFLLLQKCSEVLVCIEDTQ